jgi:transglutaminase-like putative cysteine protease
VNFRIKHRLTYHYASPAVLGPHILRLRPRDDGSQRVLDQNLTVEPLPSLLSRQADAYGNVEHRAWFLGSTSVLSIESECVVETQRVNPFDYILDPAFNTLPYGPSFLEAYPGLEPYLKSEAAPAAAALAQKICSEAKGEATAFVLRLNKWIFEHLSQEHREHGEAWPADQTLLEQRGACRDVAQLFLACARSLGLPGRFVSGYFEGDSELRNKDLHAWVEVYLPGGGWRGFDPSCGLAVADRHIALCAAPRPEGAAAISGTFGAPLGGSTLVAEVLFM